VRGGPGPQKTANTQKRGQEISVGCVVVWHGPKGKSGGIKKHKKRKKDWARKEGKNVPRGEQSKKEKRVLYPAPKKGHKGPKTGKKGADVREKRKKNDRVFGRW